MTAPPAARLPLLSVVIPSFQSAQWLPSTLSALGAALSAAEVDAEIIVVDDGSTDDTQSAVDVTRPMLPAPVHLVRQPNLGRYQARKRGLAEARGSLILLLDSRVLIHVDALAFALPLAASGAIPVWNAHVETDPSAALIGHFWEVPTRIFWGSYLRTPRTTDLTLENFDSAPKGTTMFLAPRDVLLRAFESARPEGDTKLMSDDTKILRWIAGTTGIHLDPRFAAMYRPRTTLRAFVRHAFDRGTLFVDSYAGTRPARSATLVALVIVPPLALLSLLWSILTGRGALTLVLLSAGLLALVSAVIPARRNGCAGRGIAAFLVYMLPFGGPFWAGLARGIVVHRASFRRRATKERP